MFNRSLLIRVVKDPADNTPAEIIGLDLDKVGNLVQQNAKNVAIFAAGAYAFIKFCDTLSQVIVNASPKR